MEIMERVKQCADELRDKRDGPYSVKENALNDMVSFMNHVIKNVPNVTCPDIKFADKDIRFLPVSLESEPDKGRALSGNVKVTWRKNVNYVTVRFYGDQDIHMKAVVRTVNTSVSMKLSDMLKDKFPSLSIYDIIDALMKK